MLQLIKSFISPTTATGNAQCIEGAWLGNFSQPRPCVYRPSSVYEFQKFRNYELPPSLRYVPHLLRAGGSVWSPPAANNNYQGRCYSLPQLSPPNCKCLCPPGQVGAISGGGCGKHFSCSGGGQVSRRCRGQHCLQRYYDMDQGVWTHK